MKDVINLSSGNTEVVSVSSGSPEVINISSGGLETVVVEMATNAGPKGDPGPVNKLGIGTVTSGTVADATVTGDYPDQKLNLILPKGDKGNVGDVGPAGPPNILSINTVTRGDTAAATITGTSPSQQLNLVLPKGDTGPTGAKGVVIGITEPSTDQLWADTSVTPVLSQVDGGTYAAAQTIIKVRRGTTSQWAATTVLSDGEIGFDSTSKTIKIGNGTDQWSLLTSISGSGSGGGSFTDPQFSGTATFAGPARFNSTTGLVNFYGPASFNSTTNAVNFYGPTSFNSTTSTIGFSGPASFTNTASFTGAVTFTSTSSADFSNVTSVKFNNAGVNFTGATTNFTNATLNFTGATVNGFAISVIDGGSA
jgi:hypothetical protein